MLLLLRHCVRVLRADPWDCATHVVQLAAQLPASSHSMRGNCRISKVISHLWSRRQLTGQPCRPSRPRRSESDSEAIIGHNHFAKATLANSQRHHLPTALIGLAFGQHTLGIVHPAAAASATPDQSDAANGQPLPHHQTARRDRSKNPPPWLRTNLKETNRT